MDSAKQQGWQNEIPHVASGGVPSLHLPGAGAVRYHGAGSLNKTPALLVRLVSGAMTPHQLRRHHGNDLFVLRRCYVGDGRRP